MLFLLFLIRNTGAVIHKRRTIFARTNQILGEAQRSFFFPPISASVAAAFLTIRARDRQENVGSAESESGQKQEFVICLMKLCICLFCLCGCDSVSSPRGPNSLKLSLCKYRFSPKTALFF